MENSRATVQLTPNGFGACHIYVVFEGKLSLRQELQQTMRVLTDKTDGLQNEHHTRLLHVFQATSRLLIAVSSELFITGSH